MSKTRHGEHLTRFSHLIRMLERPAVDTVVGGVEAALWEPGDVPCLEAAGADSVEGAIPVKSVPGHLRSVR